MTDSDPSAGAPAPGLRAAIDSLKTQAGRYAGARLALLRLEAGEAAAEASHRAKIGGAAMALLFFGYLLLLAGLIGLAERHQPGSWPIAALIGAACHLLLGIPFLVAATRKGSKPWFRDSLDQIKADEQWMRTLSPRTPEKKPPNP